MAENNDQYKIVTSIDTVVQFSSADVTQRLLRMSSRILVDFITGGLTKSPDGQSFSWSDLRNIDNIQKSVIPLYSATQYNDGVYKEYDEFKTKCHQLALLAPRSTNVIN